MEILIMETNEYILSVCKAARDAAPLMACASAKERTDALTAAAGLLRRRSAEILRENEKDLASPAVPAKMLDRLRLTEKRIEMISDALLELCRLPDPLGRGECWTRPNGLTISKVSVPLGVVAMIYEARPNVTADAAALCIKTGNAAVLRGGKEAINTNRVIVRLLREALAEAGLPEDGVSLVDDVTREGSTALMNMRGYVDVLVPRGGAGLIRSVVENARVPVIETGAGNCHVYVDASADPETAVRITINAKVSRPSVCNSAESLLVHSAAVGAFLPLFEKAAADCGVELRVCPRTREILGSSTRANVVLADEEDFYTEYNDLIMSVKIVNSVEEAIGHINKYGTHHSDAIVTRDIASAETFQRGVDSAAVYVNASTRFTDGGEFGFGAELGISTQKLHARGPMGLEALTSVKYLVCGNGQIRQ